MAWDRSAPTDPKYRSAEHRSLRAGLVDQLDRDGFLTCLAEKCLFPTRVITNPNGNAKAGLTLGHMPDGVTYNGAEHRACNIHEAAVRANLLSRGIGKPRRWVV